MSPEAILNLITIFSELRDDQEPLIKQEPGANCRDNDDSSRGSEDLSSTNNKRVFTSSGICRGEEPQSVNCSTQFLCSDCLGDVGVDEAGPPSKVCRKVVVKSCERNARQQEPGWNQHNELDSGQS